MRPFGSKIREPFPPTMKYRIKYHHCVPRPVEQLAIFASALTLLHDRCPSAPLWNKGCADRDSMAKNCGVPAKSGFL